jgi:hypothetical protein
MVYRMIVADLDGTLKSESNPTFTLRVREAIERARARGVRVVLATGRMFQTGTVYRERGLSIGHLRSWRAHIDVITSSPFQRVAQLMRQLHSRMEARHRLRRRRAIYKPNRYHRIRFIFARISASP